MRIPREVLTFSRFVFGFTASMYLSCFAYVTVNRMMYQEEAAKVFDSASGKPHAAVARRSNYPVGRLTVPRLDVSAMVNEGVDDDTLSIAVGHLPSTPLPGTPGNVAVAGHRDTFFRSLKDLRKDDEIFFTTKDGWFRYRVNSMKIVEPDAMEVLDPTAKPALTLITCYPFEFFGHAPKRFVVQATQVSSHRL